MNDPLDDKVRQDRLGYLIFSEDGEEVPIITERLHYKPLAESLVDELDVELKAQAELLHQQAARHMQRASEMDWLTAVIRPLVEKYDAPEAPMSKLVELLPEPDRRRILPLGAC